MPVCKYCDCGKRTDDYNYDLDKCKECVENNIKNTYYEQCKCGRDIVPNKVHYCDSDVLKVIKEKEDIINKPNHYHEGGIDPFTYGEANLTSTEMLGFYKMNVIKYLTRAGKKDDMIQDFKKAQKYMNKLVEFMEK